MKLTSQEEYGLRCILNLARMNGDTESMTVGRIAEHEGLSTEYAGKLMGILGRAGLVDSVRGRNGGYRLARPAEEISAAEALDALGSKLYEVETCDRFSGDHSLCVHTAACSLRSIWSGIQQIIDHVLTRTSLRDLARTGEVSMTRKFDDYTGVLLDSTAGETGLIQIRPPEPKALRDQTS